MKGKSWSISIGMVSKEHYCSKCGAKLETERTHRVVTKEDKDYYKYHDVGKFPKYDYDVYEHRFKCPSCNARVSHEEQRIIEVIQKKCGHNVLSSGEKSANYKESKKIVNKRRLTKIIMQPSVYNAIFLSLFYLFSGDKTSKDLILIIGLYVVATVAMIERGMRRYTGNYKFKYQQRYSYEKESQLQRLHTYATHNRELIETSDKCYCFYCKSIIDSSEIKDYIDNGQTALCPKCGIDSIIPDGIEEDVNEEIVDEMNQYWF